MFRRKLFSLLLISVIVFSNINYSYSAGIACSADPSTAEKIFMKATQTLYNVFPIEIAGVSFEMVDLPTEDTLGGEPICVCIIGYIPRVGIPYAWWNPQATVETVKAPFCFPTIGFGLAGGEFYSQGNASASGSNKQDSDKKNNRVFANSHYIKYPLFALMGLFSDVACINNVVSGDDIDILYLTELDPIWKNDQLAIIRNPEAVLFANPVAQLACMADSAKTVTGSAPFNVLFWCMGSWGSVYPLAGTAQGNQNLGNAGLVAKLLYVMSRSFMIWKTAGEDVMCQPRIMPVWHKTQFSIFEAYPRLYSKRFMIGYTDIDWGIAANPPIPTKCDNYVWFVYQHHSCCMF